jgi:hypothetical protein
MGAEAVAKGLMWYVTVALHRAISRQGAWMAANRGASLLLAGMQRRSMSPGLRCVPSGLRAIVPRETTAAG